MEITDVAIVGAGIVGLAHALAAARRGLRVTVFERDERAVGASIRNFGLPYPVALALTPVHRRALRSREIWIEAAREAGFWLDQNGTLFLAYHKDEEAVLREFLAAACDPSYRWVPRDEIERLTPGARVDGLRGGVFSSTELTVDPREAIKALPVWLGEKYGVRFFFGCPVHAVQHPSLHTLAGEWRADQIVVCSGADFETLYPQVYRQSGLTKCRLQMMRLEAPDAHWRLGPSLCSGWTISRYSNFQGCPSVGALLKRLQRDWPEHVPWDIHVLLAQNRHGEFVVGDTHEYGLTFDPFSRDRADQLILDYLHTFAAFPRTATIAERWQGVYTKLDGQHKFIARPQPGVTIAQVTNGLGMTQSFGLGEEVVAGFA
jgi:FAD dependent oxidoreductase TIGR03364